MAIHNVQGKPREAPLKHKLYQPDDGVENVTLRALKRKNTISASQREWEKLGVGAQKPEPWGPYTGA